MDDKAAIANESWIIRVERAVVVDVLRVESWDRGNVAILAGEITHLAGLRLSGIAWRIFGAVLRVEMLTSRVAAAIRGNWVLVNVVHCELC